MNHRELTVETETAHAVRDGVDQEAVVAHIDEDPGVPGHDAGHLAALSHQVPVALAESPQTGVNLQREHRASLSPGPDQVVLWENICYLNIKNPFVPELTKFKIE